GTPRLAYGANLVGAGLYFSIEWENPDLIELTAQLTNPPLLPAAANPTPNRAAPGPLGVWGYDRGTGRYFFGWPMTSPSGGVPRPLQASYAVQVVTPGAAYARAYYGGVVPAGSDFGYIDISNEDYSGLVLNNAQFLNCNCVGTKFDRCVMLEGTFGASGNF